jgi:hypothetical protein
VKNPDGSYKECTYDEYVCECYDKDPNAKADPFKPSNPTTWFQSDPKIVGGYKGVALQSESGGGRCDPARGSDPAQDQSGDAGAGGAGGSGSPDATVPSNGDGGTSSPPANASQSGDGNGGVCRDPASSSRSQDNAGGVCQDPSSSSQ